MPRNFGSFTTSIYRDEDFTGLTSSQQAAYFMLGLQGEISAAGTLPLTVQRWAKKACDWTPDSLREQLDSLEDAGHVQIDDETQELLIVKFAKWDRGWANRKRLPVLMAALKSIESIHIRDKVVDELQRIVHTNALSDDEKQAQDALSDALRDAVSGFDRSWVTEGNHSREPEPGNHEGEPPDDPDSPFCPPHQPDGPGGKPCTACADRAKALKHRAARAALETAEAKAAATQAIRDCDRCNENGFIEGPGGELLGVCGHTKPPLSVVGRGKTA